MGNNYFCFTHQKGGRLRDVTDLFEVTQLVSVKAGIQAQVCLNSNPELSTLLCCLLGEKGAEKKWKLRTRKSSKRKKRKVFPPP